MNPENLKNNSIQPQELLIQKPQISSRKKSTKENTMREPENDWKLERQV